MSRSQARLRYREGIDRVGRTAYAFGETSLKTLAEQRAAAIAFGARPGPAPSVVPAITGTTKVGSTLTRSAGTWSVQGTPSYATQWLRGNTPISGATSSTYVLTAADMGYPITCRMTATDDYGVTTYDMAFTAPIQQMDAPVNTVAPAITGTPTNGQTLTTTNGTWTGSGTITYTRAWRRDGVVVAGQTATTYVLGASDVGATITCMATATNAGGSTDQVSNSVGPIS